MDLARHVKYNNFPDFQEYISNKNLLYNAFQKNRFFSEKFVIHAGQ